MNILFLLLLVSGASAMLLTGNADRVMTALIEGAGSAVETVLRTFGAYLFWMGLLGVGKEAGLVRALSRLLSPVLRLLFPDAGNAKEAISLNLAANMLGMGNAATPYGIEAMRLLNEANPRPGVATNGMCTLLALNASCLELFPATLVGLRASYGSHDPGAVILPTLLSSLLATVAAAVLCLAFTRPCRSRF
jgi:spore maturation protein A